MARRGADSRERLVKAAQELFRDRGFGDVTAAEIASRAGLTERTFFRHFADKREMLFGDATTMVDLAVAAIDAAGEASPFQRVMAGLHAVVPLFEGRLDIVRERQRIIDADTELQERELGKRFRFARALAAALADAGVDPAIAPLWGELGGMIFHDAFTQWLAGESPDLAAAITHSASRLRDAVAEG